MSSRFAHGIGLSGREPSASNRRRPPLLHLFLLQVPHSHGCPQSQSLRSCGTPQASSQRTKRPLRIPRCSNSSRSSPIPSRADATWPSSSLSSSPADADRRSSTSQPAMSPIDDSAAFYRYLGKGGVRGRRELPRPALDRHRSVTRRCRQGSLPNASFRVALAGGRWSPGRLQRYLLQPLPGLSPRRPASRPRAFTSSDTPPPSSAVTSASRSSP